MVVWLPIRVLRPSVDCEGRGEPSFGGGASLRPSRPPRPVGPSFENRKLNGNRKVHKDAGARFKNKISAQTHRQMTPLDLVLL